MGALRRRFSMGGSKSALLAVLSLLLPMLASPASAQYNVERSDPFAMLSATLQTYQGSQVIPYHVQMDLPAPNTLLGSDRALIEI